jgi:hypothetical protein
MLVQVIILIRRLNDCLIRLLLKQHHCLAIVAHQERALFGPLLSLYDLFVAQKIGAVHSFFQSFEYEHIEETVLIHTSLSNKSITNDLKVIYSY